MTAIVDEGVPHELVRRLRSMGLDIVAFPKRWKGTKNGSLLRLIEQDGFDCLVTCDRSMQSQQTIANFSFALVVLPVQKLPDLLPLLDMVADAIRMAQPGTVSLVRR